MEFQGGMALCSHGSKFASKSWKFVWKGRVITRRQFPSKKKNPFRCFLFPRGELPLGPYEFPLVPGSGSDFSIKMKHWLIGARF